MDVHKFRIMVTFDKCHDIKPGAKAWTGDTGREGGGGGRGILGGREGGVSTICDLYGDALESKQMY